MLEGAPWLLAHKSMLEIDRPEKVSLYGRDYVIWKDRNGKVSALPNACPHMGAMLSEGWCDGSADGSSRVVCPFHALEFDRQGCTVLPGSQKKTLPQLEPLALEVRGDFIWSYGGCEPKMPIPDILDRIAGEYQFVGATAETSIDVPLLPMLLNMHDYNHQNGTHRDLFRIEEVRFEKFIDRGHHSEAFFSAPTASPTLREIWQNPTVLMVPKVIEAHLDNYFPSLVIFYGTNVAGSIAQCHLFVPEAENRTRTYVLFFGQPSSPMFHVLKSSLLQLAQTVVAQDTDILTKIYARTSQKMKLNNEVGMDWVHRNMASWPEVSQPDLSR
ncbi:MAG: Rieske 2Fe-2S domain-containing protein [Cyanobacteriota bacterium]|nr:Rieske 2Fe-2S domain-containing protein [Cyanobacteriota bacterium]